VAESRLEVDPRLQLDDSLIRQLAQAPAEDGLVEELI
jgi:hypothetical protein